MRRQIVPEPGLTAAQVQAAIVAGTSTFQTAAQVSTAIAGARVKEAILYDVKSAGTAGGTPSAINTWITRALNTGHDPDGIVSISSDEFTLQPGTYEIMWVMPAVGAHPFKSRLYDVTNSEVVGRYGSAGYNDRSDAATQAHSFGVTTILIASATVYRLEAIVGWNSAGGELGKPAGQSVEEVYTQVVIRKYA